MNFFQKNREFFQKITTFLKKHEFFYKITRFTKSHHFTKSRDLQNHIISKNHAIYKITLFQKITRFTKSRYFQNHAIFYHSLLFLKLPCFKKKIPRSKFIFEFPV